MDDLHPVETRNRATWQSEAEKQSEHKPRWRRTVGIVLTVLVVLALITGGVAWWAERAAF